MNLNRLCTSRQSNTEDLATTATPILQWQVSRPSSDVVMYAGRTEIWGLWATWRVLWCDRREGPEKGIFSFIYSFRPQLNDPRCIKHWIAFCIGLGVQLHDAEAIWCNFSPFSQSEETTPLWRWGENEYNLLRSAFHLLYCTDPVWLHSKASFWHKISFQFYHRQSI